MSVNLDQIVQKHQDYYLNSQPYPQRDETESGSITPRAIVPSPIERLTKEYTADGTSSNSNVKRFLIDIPQAPQDQNCKDREKEAFTRAIEHLMKKTYSFEERQSNSSLDANNVVLLDIFVRKEDKQGSSSSKRKTSAGSTRAQDRAINFENNNKPEFHTVCLWKTGQASIMLLDPTDIKKTYEQVVGIVQDLYPKTVLIQLQQFGLSLSSDEFRFYGPAKGPIAPPQIGFEDGMRRDCIDIAVKMAFGLIQAQQGSSAITEVGIIDKIKPLSNQHRINPAIGPEYNGPFVRALQSSDPAIRENTCKFFADNIKICNLLTVHKFSDLVEIEESRETLNNIHLNQGAGLKGLKGITLDQLKKIDKLLETFKWFNDSNLLMLELNFSLTGDISGYIEEKERNWTKFHIAAKEDRSIDAAFDQCFGSGANITKEITNVIGWPDVYGQTALHWAADRGNLAACNWLYDRMTPERICHQMNGRCHTALHLGVHSNRTEAVGLLVKKEEVKNPGRKLIGIPDAYGQTPLHAAASAGFLEICKILYDVMTPAQVSHQTNNEGYTALHFAVQGKHEAIIKLLISKEEVKKEQLIGICDNYGQTAWFWATSNGCSEEICNMLKI